MAAIASSLATIAASAYSATLAGLPSGFTALGLPGTANGTFANQNAFGAAVTGRLGDQTVVVLAFRGSDDRQDWINDLRDINTDYGLLAPLVSAVDTYAAQNHATVVVTGHSLGGALAQVFMANHPADTGVAYHGVTFGSPGALIGAAPDDRIVNYEIADDPVPYFGFYRSEIGQTAQADPGYAAAFSLSVSALVGDGLTPLDVGASIPSLTADYFNRGHSYFVTGANGSHSLLTPSQFVDADNFDDLARYGGEHDPAQYIARTSGASVPDPTLNPAAPMEVDGAFVYRFVDTRTGDHFYTTSLFEQQQIERTIPSFAFEGTAFAAPMQSSDTHDVFRFFDTAGGGHFYTESAVERDIILNTLPNYHYEGVGFQAFNGSAAGAAGTVTLERFYNTQTGQHHFAANAAEAASISTGMAGPGWVDEGQAFTVYLPTDVLLA